ncbi:UPF0481 protein [Gossypium australe]|uniref:UPF0481 protein n=1 Tax=Gossypium australe TaxID=47621 RepID=A0A5B6VSK5_9ROSI|nr:UPF0481 protein [Gossypium australe]
MGNLHYFLGIKVARSSTGNLHNCQRKYILDILDRSLLTNAKGIHTPMISSSALSKDEGDCLPNPREYRSLVGTERRGHTIQWIGEYEEVAKLFNKLNTDLVPSPMIYSGVKGKIHNHCKNMWINHAAQGYSGVRSPWTFLAFVGAISAHLLGALQTYSAIHQPK